VAAQVTQQTDTAPPKPVQRWSAADYAKNGRFVQELAGPVFGMLGAKPGERILDLGCGDGALTAEIKALGAHVLGVDLSDELLAVARMKGLNVRKVDGHALDFVSEFDAVFSNAALHWMRKPHLVIAGVARALRPRGRFIGELGGHGNVAAIATAMRAVGAEMSSRSRAGPAARATARSTHPASTLPSIASRRPAASRRTARR